MKESKLKKNNINFMIEHLKQSEKRITPQIAERALLISLIDYYGEDTVGYYADLLKGLNLWGSDQKGRNNKYRFLNSIKSDIEKYRTSRNAKEDRETREDNGHLS